MDETSRRILLAEDDRFLRRAAEATLKRVGHTVLTAADGEEALAKARTERPDLILLDLIMPRLQGFEVLRLLKADPATADIPVIVLSNLGQDRDVQQALAELDDLFRRATPSHEDSTDAIRAERDMR